MPDRTIVLPIHCSRCGGPLTVECEDGKSHDFLSAEYECPHCHHTVAEHGLPGKPIRVSVRVNTSLKHEAEKSH